jgi:hypothetical protein
MVEVGGGRVEEVSGMAIEATGWSETDDSVALAGVASGMSVSLMCHKYTLYGNKK